MTSKRARPYLGIKKRAALMLFHVNGKGLPLGVAAEIVLDRSLTRTFIANETVVSSCRVVQSVHNDPDV